MNKKKGTIIKIAIGILAIIFVCSLVYLITYFIGLNKDIEDNTNILNEIQIDETQISEEKSERMLQLEELREENNEIIGWIEIEDTNINYPVLQTDNNDFYMNHNYKKEYSAPGSLFLDKDFDLENGSSNYLIYGHRNKNGLMFEDLMNYANEDFYNEHKKIRFTTLDEDCEYEVLAVFYSRVYYKSEKDVFRYYYFVNAKNEQEYNEYVTNSLIASIYDTGVTAKYGDQLLTLSTCEYSQEDGRFVVVFKKVN